jgi:hypothetical protein
MLSGISVNAAIRRADINGNSTADQNYCDSSSSSRMQAVDIGELLSAGPQPNLLLGTSNIQPPTSNGGVCYGPTVRRKYLALVPLIRLVNQ